MSETRSGGARHATGGCLCGGVRYRVHEPLRAVISCHCGQCRRSHGHYSAYTAVAREGLVLTEARGLRWYRSSPAARRGFCATCGSSLFWQADGHPYTAIAAGTLDPPSGLHTAGHIFVADQGDYYRISDHLPRWAGSMHAAAGAGNDPGHDP